MKVFVAGPYTNGDVAANVAQAIEVADHLARMGHTPFVPHLSHFWHLQHQHPYEFWTRMDDEWLAVCEAMIRLPGISPGADREVALARGLGCPVYDSVDAFLAG